MKHAELIARLEAEEVGSWALDSDIFEALNLRTPRHDGLKSTTCPNVSESLDAALALAVRLFGERNAASMLFIVAGSGDDIKRFPIRLCTAVLRALDAQEGA